MGYTVADMTSSNYYHFELGHKVNLLQKLFKGVECSLIISKVTTFFKSMKYRKKFNIISNLLPLYQTLVNEKQKQKMVKKLNVSNCNILSFILDLSKIEFLRGMYWKFKTTF